MIGGRRVGRGGAADALDAMLLVSRYLASYRESAIKGKMGDRHEEHLLFLLLVIK
jgi:hypothetical protein